VLPDTIGHDLSAVNGAPRESSPWLEHRVSVVIPALNEAGNLKYVLPRIPRWVHEVLLVDGESTDGTPRVAEQLLPGIRVVAQQGRGKGAALRSGFAAATGDIIVMLDADGSTDPAEIPAFVGVLLGGADFVKGSRFLQGGGTEDMPIHRQIGNRAFVMLVQLLIGGRFTDLCYGYNAFWSQTIRSLDLDGDGFEIETMMNVRALKAGFKVAEVASFEAKRVSGIARLQTIPDGWRVLKTIFREWRRAPVRCELAGVAVTANDTHPLGGVDRHVVSSVRPSRAAHHVSRSLHRRDHTSVGP